MDWIVIDFTGWLRIKPENAQFQHMETEEVITGAQWLALSEDDRSNYVIEDIVAAMRDSDDLEWEDIEVTTGMDLDI